MPQIKKRLSSFGGKAALSFLIKVMAAGLAFVLQLLLARLMDKTEYGTYTYVIAWMTIAVIFVPLGINRTAVRFIPTYLSQEKYLTLRKYVKWMFSMTFISSIFFTFLIAYGIVFITTSIEPSLKIGLLLGCLLVPVNTMVQLFIETMRGFRHVVFSEFANAVLRPLLIGLTVLAFYVNGLHKPEASLVLIVNIVAGVTIAFILTVSTYKLFKPLPQTQDTPVSMDKSLWLGMAMPLLFVAGGNMIQSKTDIVMLGAMSGTTSSGLYNAAANITQLIGMPLLAINTILAPVIAQLYTKNQRQELQHIVKRAAYWAFFANLGLAAIVFIAAEMLLGLFGAHFVDQADTLKVLLFSQVVAGMSGPSGYLLSMTGMQRYLASTVGFCAALNIVLNFYLIPGFGTLGAATATLTSVAVANIVNTILAIKATAINPTIFPIKLKTSD